MCAECHAPWRGAVVCPPSRKAWPLGEREVGSDDGQEELVAGGAHAEEQFALDRIEGHEAAFFGHVHRRRVAQARIG